MQKLEVILGKYFITVLPCLLFYYYFKNICRIFFFQLIAANAADFQFRVLQQDLAPAP